MSSPITIVFGLTNQPMVVAIGRGGGPEPTLNFENTLKKIKEILGYV